MNNSIDRQYKELLEHLLHFGVEKTGRNGKTLSTFGWQIRHRMKEGFPLLTTKKVHFKSVVTELLWFLRGDTNIKYLVDNNCHIWDGDAYSNYRKVTKREIELNNAMVHHPDYNLHQEQFIEKIKTDERFAKQWGDLGPIYGKQWRSWKFTDKFTNGKEVAYVNGNVDQITNLISELKTNPDSRRLMVNAWNVGELDNMVLPPCHYGFQLYTRELSLEERNYCWPNKVYRGILSGTHALPDELEDYKKTFDKEGRPTRAISLMWNQRSVDTFLGLPFNIASYALLLEIIAKEVNMVPEDLIGNLGDVHLYEAHIDAAKEQITRTPYELPKLNINTEFWQTESGECGVGPLKTNLTGFEIDDFQIGNYQSHPAIKAPLIN